MKYGIVCICIVFDGCDYSFSISPRLSVGKAEVINEFLFIPEIECSVKINLVEILSYSYVNNT